MKFEEGELLFFNLQVDEGGSKRFFQNMWTSFLKARLVCGFPDESLYFNRLQDIFVMHADDWHDTRIYALFSSSWCDHFPSLYLSNQAITQRTNRQCQNRGSNAVLGFKFCSSLTNVIIPQYSSAVATKLS